MAPSIPTESDGALHDTGLRPEELDPERPRAVQTPWGEFALYLVDGEALAAQSFCPHMAGPLFQGTRDGDTITCPWHYWRFSLRGGERLDGEVGGSGDERLELLRVRLGPEGTIVLARIGHGA